LGFVGMEMYHQATLASFPIAFTRSYIV
jgi:hypothetical protein